MDRRNQPNDPLTPRVVSIPASSVVARRAGARTPTDGGVATETKADLGTWLTAGRTARGLTREHVARVTRIQLRTLERLEEGRFDELPADVFVRGFIRNYASCVGLSVDEALARYAACGFAAAPVASPQAQALLDTMAPLAPVASRTSSVVVVPSAPRILRTPDQTSMTPVAGAPVASAPVASPPATPVVVAPPADAASSGAMTASSSGAMAAAGKTRPVRDARGRFVRKGTLSQPLEAVDVEALGLGAEAVAFGDGGGYDDLEVEITVADSIAETVAAPFPVEAVAPSEPPSEPLIDQVEHKTSMPPRGVRSPTTDRIVLTLRPPAAPAPTLVIDDDDPDAAERERDDRAARARDKDGGWRSFLPPALLDQDRGRQGGLTLAVIILLIVATLTLSYLMRRPSSTGEGVTARPSIPTSVA